MKQFLDFFPVLIFAIVYFATENMITATAVLIAASALQLAIGYFTTGSVDKMHKYTFLVLLVFGGFTIGLNDPLYIKWKPTVLNWLFAVILLGSEFIGKENLLKKMVTMALQKSPDIQLSMPDKQWTWVNLSWVLFFIVVGCLNLYVAFSYSEPTWVKFKLIGLTLLNLGFMMLQFTYLSRYMKQTPPEEPKG